MKLACPRPFSAGSTVGDHDMDVGDAAVRDPGLRPVDDPLVVGLVVDSARAQRGHVRAGVGLAHAEGTELDLVGGAVALRHPLHDLLRGAVARDACRGEGGSEDREADAGVAPPQLLEAHRQRQAGGIGECVRHEVEAVEADVRRLLHDGPWELLTLVPLVSDRAHHVLGEVVDPLLQLQLVLVEVEREVRHALQVTQR